VKTPTAKRGTVTVHTFKGKIRIRLPRHISNGKQCHLYTGLDSTPWNFKQAQMVALTLESDIERGTLDTSLNKYKEAFKALKTPQTIDIAKKSPDLLAIWVKYAEFKKPHISKASYHDDFAGRFRRSIEKLPSKDLTLASAIAIRDYLLVNHSADSAKRLLVQYNACAKWALKSGLITLNPFDSLAADIKSKSSNWVDIDPFLPNEREAIINAFATHDKYHGYTDFVKFCFLTGSRLGEAISLQWQHISQECNEILFCETYNRKFGRKCTKTNKIRKFPCNPQLKAFLKSIRPVGYVSEGLVFPSPVDGGVIKLKTFHNVWKGYQPSKATGIKGIVTLLVEDGLVARYRTPYNCRHTFISQCLEHGITAQQISRWVGNSPGTIYRCYAGVVRSAEVPEL
jgi:integrase